MKQVTIRLEERQAGLIVAALDFYSRFGMGQLEELYWKLRERFWKPEESEEKWQAVEAHIHDIKHTVFGLPAHGSMGIYNENVVPVAREAYDMQQVLRKALAEARWEASEALRPPEERGGWKMGVDFHDYLPAHPEWPPITVEIVDLMAPKVMDFADARLESVLQEIKPLAWPESKVDRLAKLVREVYGLNAGGVPWEDSATKEILEETLGERDIPQEPLTMGTRTVPPGYGDSVSPSWREAVEKEIATWKAFPGGTAPILPLPTSPRRQYAFFTEHDMPPPVFGQNPRKEDRPDRRWWGDTAPCSAGVQEVVPGMMLNGGSDGATGYIIRAVGTWGECKTALDGLNEVGQPWAEWLAAWKAATGKVPPDDGESS
jgi:hypothetical protein